MRHDSDAGTLQRKFAGGPGGKNKYESEFDLGFAASFLWRASAGAPEESKSTSQRKGDINYKGDTSRYLKRGNATCARRLLIDQRAQYIENRLYELM